MKVQKFIEVRLTKKRITPVIDLVQYDTGIQLVFSLVDFDIPDGTTAILYVQKRSGKFAYQEENITIDGNEITIDLENQALTEHGETKYQIMLTNGDDTITTFAGVLRIEASLADANAVESKTVIRAFDEVVADHVAEFQTKAEQIVAACIATIPDDYTTMEAKVNELANAVKGNLSGAVIVADDVSPVEHEPEVWVHGKNLIPYPYALSNVTDGGITFTALEDGGVTVTGTSDGTFAGMTLYSGKAITKQGCAVLSLSGEYEGVYIRMDIKDANGTTLYAGGAENKVAVINLEDYPSAETWDIFIRNQNNATTVYGTAYPQVELGDTATEHEPYIDPSTVTVTADGVEYIPSSDGVVGGILSTALASGITTDNSAVIVECEYNRDTNKVIEKLTNAIIALGGTV